MATERSLVRRLLGSRFAVVAAYATTVGIWGTTWLGIKASLHGLPPLAGSGARFIIAAIVLYLAALATRADLRTHRPPLHLIVVLAATMFGFNYALTYLAETHLASGLVAVLFGTMPFFIFGFAHFMTRERITRARVGGAALSLAGVALISLAGTLHGNFWFIIATIAASASSGFANVYLKRFADAAPLATLPPAMLLAGIGLAGSGLFVEHVDVAAALAPSSVLALLYLALGGSALAFFLNHWLLQRIDASVMGLSALMIPVIAVIVGALLGGEVFGARDLAGAALVMAGVWISLRKKSPLREFEPFRIEVESPVLAMR